MSYARTPKAATIAPAPIKLHTVTTSVTPPKSTSDSRTRTMVSKFPTDVITGPQMPKRICKYATINIELTVLNHDVIHTMNPALNRTPDNTMPVIVRYVNALVGSEKSSTLK